MVKLLPSLVIWSVVALVLGSGLAAAGSLAIVDDQGETWLIVPLVADPGVVIDGIITPGEYPVSYVDPETRIELHMVHDSSELWVAVTCPGTGWCGVGFGPAGTGMQDANLIMGFVLPDGREALADGFGDNYSMTLDTSAGGTFDVTGSLSEADGRTLFEFRIPLNSGDGRDFPLLIGTRVGLILAYHLDADDLQTQHTTMVQVGLILLDATARQPMLSMTAPGVVMAGEDVLAIATLTDDRGVPIANSILRFARLDETGRSILGQETTDHQGRATMTIQTSGLDPQVWLEVSYTGNTSGLDAHGLPIPVLNPVTTTSLLTILGLGADVEEDDPTTSDLPEWWQVLLVVMGTGLVVVAIVAMLRSRRTPPPA